MKIRIKFAKRGSLKFVGHLDVMRYFQKLIRRAEIDICYSEGFNPHQKMSFAQPLGVGMLSEGEYVDIEVNSLLSSEEAIRKLNEHNVPGMEILSYRLLDENSQNAMSSVAAADYIVRFRTGYAPENFDFFNEFNNFYNSNSEITVIKETKKSQAEINIKPYIFKFESYEGDRALKIMLSTGSVVNIKPELVMNAFCGYAGIEICDFTFEYTRMEVYGLDENNNYLPLEEFGKVIL